MRGTVEPPIAWLQASVTLVPHVVVHPPLRTAAVVVLGCSNTTGNTLTSYSLITTFLLADSAAGLVRN